MKLFRETSSTLSSLSHNFLGLQRRRNAAAGGCYRSGRASRSASSGSPLGGCLLLLFGALFLQQQLPCLAASSTSFTGSSIAVVTGATGGALRRLVEG